MKVTIVRHGQTDYNKNNKMQGKSNISLNDIGRKQARKIKEQINDKHYDICFSSPLIRAMETAMILVGDRVEIIRDDRLIERDLGSLEGKDRKYYDKKKYWDYKLNDQTDGVESIQSIFKRANNFIEYLKENYEDKSILIVSHGAMIRAIHHILYKTDLNTDLTNFDINNCYIEEINTK